MTQTVLKKLINELTHMSYDELVIAQKIASQKHAIFTDPEIVKAIEERLKKLGD